MSETEQAAALLRPLLPAPAPRLAIVLGSGLGTVADGLTEAAGLSYADLPGFPRTGVHSHAGRLVAGRLAGCPVIVLQGRAHYYEDGRSDGMAVPIRTLAALGCESLLLTNAAGSLHRHMGPGSVMLLSDHIAFSGRNPLIGNGVADPFIDMTAAYDPGLGRRMRHAAGQVGLTLHEGVYAWFSGPSFETPAEIRAARILGADAVGMSTVAEVILARHAGLRVAALSVIVNLAAGMADVTLSHGHTVDTMATVARDVERLIAAFVAQPDDGP